MIRHAYDPASHALVAYFSGSSSAADYERHLQAMDKLDRRGRDEQRSVAMIVVMGPDEEPPDAHWRRKLAEARKTFSAPSVYIAVVSTSAVFRGVGTAMNWISPPPPHVKVQLHPTFEEGAAWVERSQGPPRAVLRTLQMEATDTRAKAV
jgi:hypothetical protein